MYAGHGTHKAAIEWNDRAYDGAAAIGWQAAVARTALEATMVSDRMLMLARSPRVSVCECVYVLVIVSECVGHVGLWVICSAGW